MLTLVVPVGKLGSAVSHGKEPGVVTASTPIFEELCEEHRESGVAHPLADLAEPDADQEAGQGRAQADEVDEPGDDVAGSRWVVPDEKVA